MVDDKMDESLEGRPLPASPDERLRLAADPHTPRRSLASVAHDRSRRVRLAIAANPNTPDHVLWEMARKAETREKVARNPGAPDWILLDLALYGGENLREHLVDNPSTPPKALVEIAESACAGGNRYLQARVISHPKADSVVRVIVAHNPEVSEDLIRRLAEDPSDRVAWALVRNPSTPADIVLSLSKHSVPEVARSARMRLLRARMRMLWPSAWPKIFHALFFRNSRKQSRP